MHFFNFSRVSYFAQGYKGFVTENWLRPELVQYFGTEYNTFVNDFKYFLNNLLLTNLNTLNEFKLLTYFPNLVTLILPKDLWYPNAPEIEFSKWYGLPAQYTAPVDIMNGHSVIETMTAGPGF